MARQQWAKAVEGFRKLARDFPTHRVADAKDEATRVRLDRWVSGQLSDLWPKLPEGLRMGLDKQLEAEAVEATAEAIVDEAHQVCPYSNATRGNVDVGLTLA